jgi:hypothetical protein
MTLWYACSHQLLFIPGVAVYTLAIRRVVEGLIKEQKD